MQIVFCRKENGMLRAVKNGMRAALMLGMCGLLGCSGGMDDESTYQGGNNNNNQEGQNQNDELDSYIFLRHRFVAENATIPNGSDARLAWANKHFNDACSYMLQKVVDFKHKVYDLEPDGNFLQAICDEVFVDANGMPRDGYGSPDMDLNIFQNRSDYGNLLGAVAAKVTGGVNENTDLDYETFKTCYTMLAHRSYTDSLGYLKDSQNLKFNQEKASIEEDLQRLDIATDYNNVESRLDDLLETAAQRSGVSVDALRDVVNLSLMNAGLWGARDLAASAGFQLSNRNTLRVPSSQIEKLNRKDLVHNMSSFWIEYNLLEHQNNQQQEQEQSNGL